MPLTNEQKTEIQDVIFTFGKDFYRQTELTHIFNLITKDPTENGVNAAFDYLKCFAGISFGTSYANFVTSTITSLSENSLRLMLSKVSAILKRIETENENAEENEDEEENIDQG
jgi:hypothetical protein